MMKYRFKSKNLGTLLAYRKSKKSRNVSVWKNIFYHLTTALLSHWQNEHGQRKHLSQRYVIFHEFFIIF